LIFSFRLIAAGQGAARYTRPRPNADGQVEELKASKRSFNVCVRRASLKRKMLQNWYGTRAVSGWTRATPEPAQQPDRCDGPAWP
jgi:hypothetical protein